jgi:uncharacterized protein involved in outer membrane biogenesis
MHEATVMVWGCWENVVKKLGIALLGLVVLLLAAVFIAPSFVDWNAHKARVAEEVRKLTGRELTIGGDISLALLPAPALSADQVAFANLDGASAPAMAELESLEVRVALLPLIRGEIQVERVVLVKPVIRLEVMADGRRNWDLGAAGTAEPGPQAPGGGEGMAAQVRLDDLRISGGTLIYRDAIGGREETVRDLDARIAAESLQGPFAVSGAASVRAIATEFEVSLGRLPEDGATPFNVSLRLPGPGSALRFGGAVSLQPDGATLRGTLKAEGDNLAALVSTLAGSGAAPGLLAHSFAVSTDLAANPAQFAAKDIAIRMGELAVEGEATVGLDPAIDARVRLSASQINLDKLLAGPKGGASGGGSTGDGAAGSGSTGGGSAGGAAAPAGPRLVLPADVSGALDVAVDALVYRGQVVRQVLFSARLDQGKIKIDQALALLPGGSDVSLTGTVAAPEGAEGPPNFDGHLEAASDNLRGILDWFGADVTGVPAERLRKASLSARIAGTPQQVTIGDIDLSVDLSRATGGIAVALRERLGLGIGLAVDKLDLDAYLPRDASRAEPAAGDQGAEAGGAQGAAQVAAAPAALGAFDANLDLRLGALTVQGTTARDLRLDATLQQGALTLREARVGDLAGSKLQLAGLVTGLTGEPAIDGTLELKVADPARLAKLAGVEAGPAGKIGPFDLTGSFKGGLGELALDAALAALDGRLGASGTVTAPGPAATFDLALQAKHPSLARLAGVFAPDLALGPKLGGLDLSARVAGGPAEVQVSDLSGAIGPLTLAGSLGARLAGEAPGLTGYDLNVGLRHADLAELARAVNGPALDPGLGGVDLTARVSGTATRVQVDDLAGKVGPTDLSGTISADLAGARPALDVDLATGVLPVAALAAPGTASGGGASSGGAGGGAAPSAAAAPAPAGGGRWSTEPIDLSALRALDANLKLRSQALLMDKVRVDNAVIEGALKDGVLDLSKATGTTFGGAVSARGQLDARARPKAGFALTAIEVNTAALAGALADSDRVSGPLNLEASLSTEGQSQAELIGALAGNGRVDGSITVKAKREEQIGAALLGVLGQKVKEVRGITDTTNTVFNAFGGRPAAVAGTFTVDRGVVRTSDLKATGQDATALTQGTANLPAWQIDTRTDLFRAQDAATLYLTVNLSGPLDKPNVRVGGQAFQRQAAPTAPAGPQPSGQDQPAPSPVPGLPEKVDPEDMLKKGLKGLLKGLQN